MCQYQGRVVGRTVNINMQKMLVATHEAHRQRKRVHRVNIVDRPDVDLLEHIYDSATARLAPNDTIIATITFGTGVVQESIMSPQQFNIFINTLLWMLTAG